MQNLVSLSVLSVLVVKKRMELTQVPTTGVQMCPIIQHLTFKI
jgi:hypothetical protein